MGSLNLSQSQRLKHQTEEMIAHTPTVSVVEGEEAPFVFSPRTPDDKTCPRRRRRFMRNLRSVFCCGIPETLTSVGSNDSGAPSPAVYPSGSSTDFIIGEKSETDRDKKTLVLDLDETLVHSSFSCDDKPDYIIPVDIDGRSVNVYVQKRPGLETFLERVCQLYEVVIFTASLSKYAGPLIDMMDPEGQVKWRLFREACSIHKGTYVKDLARLGRELSQTIIVDNSPLSYVFQPGNALPITTFLGEPNDCALTRLLPVLEELVNADDVRGGIRDVLGEANAILLTGRGGDVTNSNQGSAIPGTYAVA